MTLRNILRSLVLTCGAASMVGCASLPEEAYYRYEPKKPGEVPARLTGGVLWGKSSIFSLGLVPPTRTDILHVDGKVVRNGEVELSPGKHLIHLWCKFDQWGTSALLEADFRSGVDYNAKTEHHFDAKRNYVFFIEEDETKRRVAELVKDGPM